jgi:hypothetical protein
MYYKIQPEQIQIHAFSSPSGDLNFQAGSNFIYANLSRNLTGFFDVTGGVSVNGVSVPVADASNVVSGSNSFVFGGISNSVVGVRNVAVNGNACTILGTGNAAINATQAIFNASSSRNTALGGEGANFGANVTGATILKDSVASSISSNGSQTLTLSFSSGTFIENGGMRIKAGNLILNGSSSGIFSGGVQVVGSATKNGVELATTGDLGSASGALNTKIINTGAYAVSASGALDTRIINTGAYAATASGTLNTKISTLSGQCVKNTGAETISGQKTFWNPSIFRETIFLQGNSGVTSGAAGRTSIIPTGSGDSAGARGLVSYSGAFMFLKISDSPHIWVRHSGQLNWP